MAPHARVPTADWQIPRARSNDIADPSSFAAERWIVKPNSHRRRPGLLVTEMAAAREHAAGGSRRA
jgi:hypothetical protein